MDLCGEVSGVCPVEKEKIPLENVDGVERMEGWLGQEDRVEEEEDGFEADKMMEGEGRGLINRSFWRVMAGLCFFFTEGNVSFAVAMGCVLYSASVHGGESTGSHSIADCP